MRLRRQLPITVSGLLRAQRPLDHLPRTQRRPVQHVERQQLVDLEDGVHPIGEKMALEQAVAVAVQTAQPPKREVHRRLDALGKHEITGLLEVPRRGDHKERREVDRIREEPTRPPDHARPRQQLAVARDVLAEELHTHGDAPVPPLKPDKQSDLGQRLPIVSERIRPQRRPKSIAGPVRVELLPAGDDPVGVVAGAEIAHGNPVGVTDDRGVLGAIEGVHAGRGDDSASAAVSLPCGVTRFANVRSRPAPR